MVRGAGWCRVLGRRARRRERRRRRGRRMRRLRVERGVGWWGEEGEMAGRKKVVKGGEARRWRGGRRG